MSLFTAKINGITPEDDLIDIYNSYPVIIDDKKDANGYYPLFYACSYDIYNTLAIMMIEKYPDAIFLTDWTNHRNPLNVVIDLCRLDMMHLVMSHSSNFINSCSVRPSLTPLQYIIQKENSTSYDKYAFMELILKHPNILVNTTNLVDETALSLACKNHDVKAIQLLLEQTDIDHSSCSTNLLASLKSSKRFDRQTLSIAFNDIEMIDYTRHDNYNEIMENDTLMIIIKIFMLHYPNILDEPIGTTENSVLHYAIMHDCCHHAIPFIIKYMKLSINCLNEEQQTPLYVACSFDKNIKVTKYLLNIPKILINKKCELGMTPLHYACFKKCVKTVNFLLNYSGVDTFTIDFEGNSLLHSAISDNHIHWSMRNPNPNVEIKPFIELLLGTDQKIRMNLMILKKNNLGHTVYDISKFWYYRFKHREPIINVDHYHVSTDRREKLLKIQYWQEVHTVLNSFLEKGRYDFYEFLMESW